MSAVIDFKGAETRFINVNRMEKTMRLVPTVARANVSYGDLLLGLEKAGIEMNDIGGIYKVSAFENAYSVLLNFEDAAEKLKSLQQIKCGDTICDVMKMSEQIITLRIHWLPMYFDNSIIQEMLNLYGEVINIEMLKTEHAKLSTYNGTREVRLKCDELGKQSLPHLINFRSGQSVLLTVPGRKPYCLRCSTVGHIRSRCPGRNYAAAVRSSNTATADAVTLPDMPPSQPDVQPGTDISDPDSTPVPAAAGSGSGGVVGLGSQQQQTDIDMSETSGSCKRGRDSEPGDDGFVKPNKTAKAQSLAQRPISLGTNFLGIAPGEYSPSDRDNQDEQDEQ